MALGTGRWLALLLTVAVVGTPRVAGFAQQQVEVGDLDIRQFIPLGEGERVELRRLTSVDAEAAELWRDLRRQAEAAVGAAPAPLETIQYEGLLHTDARRIATVAGLRDMDQLSLLGYAHAASGDRRYSDAARDLVLAWARTYRPTGNPINENKLEPVWLVYSTLSDRFTPAERAEVEAWLWEVALAVLRSGAAWIPGAHKHNWDTKRIKIVGGIGLALRDPELTTRAFDAYRHFVADARHADGTSTDLHDRDALSYHVNALTPLLALAIMADRSGLGLDGEELFAGFSPAGSSVRRSVEYVLPFASGEQVRPEWTHSTADIDRRRAEAGIARYQPGRPYDPKQATEMLELASYFEAEHALLVGRLQGREGARYPSWLVLVTDVARRRGAPPKPPPGA